jgi:predicted metal-dependent peptidase
MAGQKLVFGVLGKQRRRRIMEAVDNVDRSITSSFGEIKNFRDCDIVYGPDGTMYEPKFIVSVVEDAISIINKINEGVIKDFLAALPIVYTFYVPTMATDGSHIFINPGFVMTLLEWCDDSPVGVAFVLIHEVYHNIFKHQEREAQIADKATDHRKANRAQDYEINWVIEHSYPDKIIFHDMEEEDIMDSDLVDENGERAQLFTGITEACKGLISDKFRNMVWEDIYDNLDQVEEEVQEEPQEQEADIEIVYSQDFEDGFRDGVEDAIRALRAQGLVESAYNAVNFMRFSLLESTKVEHDGTYDDGYNEGYSRVMKMIEQLLGGGGAGGQGGGGGTPPGGPSIKESPFKNLPKIKLTFDPPTPANAGSSGNQMNQPEIERPNQKSSGTGGSGSGQGTQGDPSQQGGQSDGQGGQSDGDQNGQEAPQQNGNTQGQGNGQGKPSAGQGDDYDNADNDTGTLGQGPSTVGGKQTPQSGANGAASGQGSQGSSTGSQGTQQGTGTNQTGNNMSGADGNGTTGGESIEDLRKRVEGINANAPVQKPKVIAASGGYSGKAGASAGQHVISKEEGQKLAAEAGYDDGSDSETYMGKEDPFNNVDAIRKALKSLKANSTITGSNGTPGCGVFDLIDNVLVSIYKPTIDWKKTLAKYLKGIAVNIEDIGYNKKGIIYGRYNRLHDVEGQSAKRMLICIDTSGSVVYSGDYLRHIIANVSAICYKLGIQKINIIQFSDGVYKDTEITRSNLPPASQFAINADKTGGTSFMPVFNYIKKEYTDRHKSFQSVIFFTDDDLFSCAIPKQQDLKYANRIIWFALTDSPKKMPYGKLITITADQFNSQLTNFETNESIETREYMNKRFYKIDEAGVFGSYKKAGQALADKRKVAADVAARTADPATDDPNAVVPAPAPAPAKKKLTIMQKRQLAIDAIMQHGEFETGAALQRKQEILDAVGPWMEQCLNIKLHKKKDDISTGYWAPKTYAYITPWNTIEVKGDLRLMGNKCLTTWPAECVFENVTGNVDIGFDNSITQLPKGLPMKVDGNVRLTNMRRLQSLDGIPGYVTGKVVISACPGITTLYGAPMKCQYFMSDNFGFEEYIDYVKTTYNKIIENKSAKSGNSLYEAFAANKLRQMFNNPANKEPLELGVRKINIMWSEIPDEIIHGVYNNVLEFINLRKKGKNTTGTGFGIYILADKNDKIYAIGTGNNDGRWKGTGGWLYVRNEFIEKLEERRKLAYRANQGYNDSQDECKRMGIKYSKSDVAPKLPKPIRSMHDFVWAHLYLVPDLCARSYIIVGHNNIVDRRGSNAPEDFNFDNSSTYRENLQRSRKEAIAGIIVQGRNLNPNDPAYRKYFEQAFMTDAKYIERFSNVKSVFEVRSYVTALVDAVNAHASKTRKALLEAHTNGILDEDLFDCLYNKFTQSYIKTFRQKAADCLSVIDKIVAEKKFEKEAASIKRDMENVYNRADSWTNLPTKWMSVYTDVISSLSEIMAGIWNASKGRGDQVLAKYGNAVN